MSHAARFQCALAAACIFLAFFLLVIFLGSLFFCVWGFLRATAQMDTVNLQCVVKPWLDGELPNSTTRVCMFFCGRLIQCSIFPALIDVYTHTVQLIEKHERILKGYLLVVTVASLKITIFARRLWYYCRRRRRYCCCCFWWWCVLPFFKRLCAFAIYFFFPLDFCLTFACCRTVCCVLRPPLPLSQSSHTLLFVLFSFTGLILFLAFS